jgi:hypothetical protein
VERSIVEGSCYDCRSEPVCVVPHYQDKGWITVIVVLKNHRPSFNYKLHNRGKLCNGVDSRNHINFTLRFGIKCLTIDMLNNHVCAPVQHRRRMLGNSLASCSKGAIDAFLNLQH